ncbi:hypothetical protein [Rhodanobacter lindaniclasticus]
MVEVVAAGRRVGGVGAEVRVVPPRAASDVLSRSVMLPSNCAYSATECRLLLLASSGPQPAKPCAPPVTPELPT